jgi:hypothetical protein
MDEERGIVGDGDENDSDEEVIAPLYTLHLTLYIYIAHLSRMRELWSSF